MNRSIIAIPPGATIKEQLDIRGMEQKEFAMRMGMSEKHISHLINGKVLLTPEVALKLEDVLGIPASFWNNLEAIYREKLVRVQAEDELESDIEIAKLIPYTKIAEQGWIPKTRIPAERAKNLRSFFEVANLGILDNLMIPGIACRQVSGNSTSDYALAAWAQKARLLARDCDTAAIDIKKLKKSIPSIRELSNEEPESFCGKLRSILSDCGIVIIFLPHIGGSFLHGASFIDGKHIVLGLTVRGKDADKFWFSLFHELYHILEGHIYQDVGTNPEQECQADIFARNTLIPPNEYQSFITEGRIDRESIIAFSNKIRVPTGIVVGRLQKEEIVPYSHYRDLKTQYSISQ